MNRWEIVTLIAVGLIGWYAVSLVIHPWRACHAHNCDNGKVHDPLMRWAWGECTVCGGTGKLPRLGVRVFQRARYLRLRKKGRQS